MKKIFLSLLGAFCLSACNQPVPPAPPAAPAAALAPVAASPFKLTAGITDLMQYEIDPASDALWDSVSTLVDKTGVHNHQPRTDKEWAEQRGHAIVLAEAANLLMMEGRKVALPGHEVEDAGTLGNLTAAEAEKAIAENRAAFIGFSQALNAVAVDMIKATEAKDPEALLQTGAALDEVCEQCHLKFWYPAQKIPPLPNEAPEKR